MSTIRAIVICVDYSDILGLTLPYNRHHFGEMMVVTCERDTHTVEVAEFNNCRVHITETFYDGGALFNKWKALEEGLDAFGRDGWLCILDADVLWPKNAKLPELQPGLLYTPRRRMYPHIPLSPPDERVWFRYPHHRNEAEFAGYSQIFHASDPVLPNPPWHETNWKHAGGADSFFQRLWHPGNKVRPDFDVLHLGEAGVNWCGRSDAGRSALKQMMNVRRRTRQYNHEKI